MQSLRRKPRTQGNFIRVLAMVVVLPLAAYGEAGSQSRANLRDAASITTSSATALPAGAIQIRVDCGSSTAKVKTITDGLKLLGSLHPAVLLISGTCHEDVLLQGLDSVTLQGNPTATIDGGSDPNSNTVAIVGSLNVSLNNLMITGGGQGVGCLGVSYCLLSAVTIENSLGSGANVQAASRLEITDSVIRNNAGTGLAIAGVGAFFGGTITGNGSDGVTLRNGGLFGANPSDVTPTVSIQNNGGFGVQASLHNTVNLNSAIISGNARDGVSLQMGSAMEMFASSITNNGGHQVRIGDLSVARFSGFQSNTITGANYPDVVCDPQFSVTRQLSANALGATTNCPAELPPTP